jgi:hypothetical protein
VLFNQLGLTAELLRAADEQCYKTATSIQRQAFSPELAAQVADSVCSHGQYLPFRATVIRGNVLNHVDHQKVTVRFPQVF